MSRLDRAAEERFFASAEFSGRFLMGQSEVHLALRRLIAALEQAGIPYAIVGALALGAALGIVAVVVRQEIVLFIMGGIFVMETVSVILQVASYKLIGKRIFKMAPLHHHFELKGWPEPRVIVRFWIITIILVLSGLATLKLR